MYAAQAVRDAGKARCDGARGRPDSVVKAADHSGVSRVLGGSAARRASAGRVEALRDPAMLCTGPDDAGRSSRGRRTRPLLATTTATGTRRGASASCWRAAAEALERPCCLLYSTDTVGASGSPVLDSDGDRVAINATRARGGLMNEFAWSQELSRSIGVDVRLML